MECARYTILEVILSPCDPRRNSNNKIQSTGRGDRKVGRERTVATGQEATESSPGAVSSAGVGEGPGRWGSRCGHWSPLQIPPSPGPAPRPTSGQRKGTMQDQRAAQPFQGTRVHAASGHVLSGAAWKKAAV